MYVFCTYTVSYILPHAKELQFLVTDVLPHNKHQTYGSKACLFSPTAVLLQRLIYHKIRTHSLLDVMFRGIQSRILPSRLLSDPSLIFITALVVVQAFESAATHSSELNRSGRLHRSEQIWNQFTGWSSSSPGGARRIAFVLSVIAA